MGLIIITKALIIVFKFIFLISLPNVRISLIIMSKFVCLMLWGNFLDVNCDFISFSSL